MRERRKDEDREMERVGPTIGYLKKILLAISTVSSIRNQNLCASLLRCHMLSLQIGRGLTKQRHSR